MCLDMGKRTHRLWKFKSDKGAHITDLKSLSLAAILFVVGVAGSPSAKALLPICEPPPTYDSSLETYVHFRGAWDMCSFLAWSFKYQRGHDDYTYPNGVRHVCTAWTMVACDTNGMTNPLPACPDNSCMEPINP